MKKLIGMSLIALFAITAENTANAQTYVDSNGNTTTVKDKGNGKHKVKVVLPPADVIYTSPSGNIDVFQEAPFFGYRRYKYYDDQGRKVIIYDNPSPYRTNHYYYHYR